MQRGDGLDNILSSPGFGIGTEQAVPNPGRKDSRVRVSSCPAEVTLVNFKTSFTKVLVNVRSKYIFLRIDPAL